MRRRRNSSARTLVMVGAADVAWACGGACNCCRRPDRKLWLLYVVDLEARGTIRLTPFLDLVLAWNKGISYGLFRQEGPLGQWALLSLKLIAAWTPLDLARARFLAAHRTIARPDHRWRDRQCDRPTGA